MNIENMPAGKFIRKARKNGWNVIVLLDASDVLAHELAKPKVKRGGKKAQLLDAHNAFVV